MTNREWLETLSDEDFAKWCTMSDEWNSIENKCEEPTPRLTNIEYATTYAFYGLLKWLKEDRKKLK